jgi:hypothetical protein
MSTEWLQSEVAALWRTVHILSPDLRGAVAIAIGRRTNRPGQISHHQLQIADGMGHGSYGHARV